MTFYLKPLSGNIDLDKFLFVSLQRLDYLLLLRRLGPDLDQLAEKVSQNGEYGHNHDAVFHGTNNDRLAHFVLVVLASVKKQFGTFFVESETLLFTHRLRVEMRDEDVFRSIRSLRRHLREFLANKNGEKWKKIYEVVDEILNEKILDHWLEYHRRPRDSENVCQVEVLVPFEVVLPLVSGRGIDCLLYTSPSPRDS